MNPSRSVLPGTTSIVAQLDRLSQAELIRVDASQPELAYIFKHALTQQAAYDSMLHTVRREVHQRVAQAYEQLYHDRLDEFSALLAYHCALAGDGAKTYLYATRAGDRAAGRSAYAEARAQYAAALHALTQLPDSEEQRRARVSTLLKQIEVAYGLDSADLNLARLFEAEALAQTLPERDRSSLARIHYWIARVYFYRHEYHRTIGYAEQLLSEAHDTGNQALLGLGSAMAGMSYYAQGNFGRAVSLVEQAIPYLERIGSWYEWMLAKFGLALCLAGQGHYGEGRRHADEAMQKALSMHNRAWIATARAQTAQLEFIAGDLRRMLDESQRLLQDSEAASPLIRYMSLGFQAWAQSRLGMHAAARATLAATDAVAASFGTRLIFDDWFAAARAEIEMNAGQCERALELAQSAAIEARAAGGLFSEGVAQRVWGQALAAVDRPGLTQAEEHFTASLELFEQASAAIEAARTHLLWGEVLLQRGERERAREHLEKAAAQFDASGTASELARTRSLIANLH